MKRSRQITLLLLGASAGAFTACSPTMHEPTLNTENVLANDFMIEGVGYYHAPFRAFFAQPYNHYDARRKQYFFGGTWASAPHQSIINVSAPTAEAIRQAEAARTQYRRGGFGRTGGSHFIHS